MIHSFQRAEPIGVVVDEAGSNADTKVAGDVLGEAGVGVPRQQHHARLRPLVHPETSKALLKIIAGFFQ